VQEPNQVLLVSTSLYICSNEIKRGALPNDLEQQAAPSDVANAQVMFEQHCGSLVFDRNTPPARISVENLCWNHDYTMCGCADNPQKCSVVSSHEL